MSAKQSTAWTVYIVECRDQTLYTGIAKDVQQRVQAHNDGRGAKYTAGRRPVTLIYQEQAPDRSAAQVREHAIKQLNAKQKRELMSA